MAAPPYGIGGPAAAMVDLVTPSAGLDASVRGAGVRTDVRSLRTMIVAAGLCCSILFVAVGVSQQLQLYGDGSMFSYAVAVEDAWAFHWHNIIGRVSVYVFATAPAEAYVHLTGDARGGIALYGFLFFAVPLL